jgi:hypothetical protein
MIDASRARTAFTGDQEEVVQEGPDGTVFDQPDAVVPRDGRRGAGCL